MKKDRPDDGVTEYTTDRGVSLYVFYDSVRGGRMAELRGDDGQRIELEFADLPRLVQTLEWALTDARKEEEERRRRLKGETA